MNVSQTVPTHISAVEFGFLTSLEIKSLAVKKITNPTTFNSLLHPNRGGLHDLALGSYRNTP
jgi:DNA-directed RNA polymerase I subunit RPA1